MTPRSKTVIKLLMNHYHQGSLAPLAKLLSEDEFHDIQQIPVQSGDFKALLDKPVSYAQTIHYSWIVPVLETFGQGQQQLFLQAFPQKQRERIAAMLKTSFSAATLPLPTRLYLLNFLFGRLLDNEDVQPLALVPDSPLKELATWKKQELVTLIDYLGLYDLAEKTRQIVDKVKLKNIFNCMSAKKIEFMRGCLKQRDQLSMTELDLDNWEGDCEKLRDLVHVRGLFRLGKAMCGQPEALLWRLSRILDTGRGKILIKCYSREEIPNASATFRQQVQRTMNHLKPQGQQ